MNTLSPIFFKELGQMAVSRKPLLMKLVLGGVLIVDFLIVLLSVGSSHEMDLGEIGSSLFQSLVLIEMAAMAVFAPVVTAGMVCGEREANTLGLLFLTKLKPWNIVQDKGLSRILFLLVISAVTLPFLFATLLFGGVEFGQIAAAMGNIVSVILFAGGVSMLCSALVHRYGAALAMSYTMLFLGYVIAPIFAKSLMRWMSILTHEWILAATSPFSSMKEVMDEHTMRLNPALLQTWSVNLLLSLLLYILAVSVGSRIIQRQAFGGNEAWRSAMWRRIKQGVFFLHPASLAHRADFVRRNPVEWKESNLLHDSLKVVLIRLADFLFVVYLLLMVALWLESELSYTKIHLGSHALAVSIMAIFSAIMAACAFTKERESGAFDVLLSTRLPGRSIVWGTFVGLWRSLLPFAVILFWIVLIGRVTTSDLRKGNIFLMPIALFLVGGIVWRLAGSLISRKGLVAWPFFITGFCYLYVSREDADIGMIIPLVNLAVFFSFILALGMAMSLRWKASLYAIGWTLGILLVVVAGISALGNLCKALFHWEWFGSFLSGCSPLFWVGTGPSANQEYGSSEMQNYLLILIAYSMITIMMLRFSASAFDRIAGRQKGP